MKKFVMVHFLEELRVRGVDGGFVVEEEFEIEVHGKVIENKGCDSFVLRSFHEKVPEDSF